MDDQEECHDVGDRCCCHRGGAHRIRDWRCTCLECPSRSDKEVTGFFVGLSVGPPKVK